MTSDLQRLTDDGLVAAVRDGDRQAAGEIARRHRPLLLATARSALRGTALEAEDAVQDVLAKLPHALSAHDRPILLQPWLRAIVRNRCLDLRRAHRPLVALPLQLTAPDTTDPAAVAERRQDVMHVVRAMGALSDRQRRALVMRAVDGRPQPEIADALNTTVAGAKALVSRSRYALRKNLQLQGAHIT